MPYIDTFWEVCVYISVLNFLFALDITFYACISEWLSVIYVTLYFQGYLQ